MKLPAFPHPSVYNLWHHLLFLLPAPYGYTATHAPGYWIDTDRGTSKVKRLLDPPPFPLQRAVINGMYELDCLMVGPGTLIMRTPLFSEFKPWFYRVDFEAIFGHRVLGVCSSFPMEFIPGSLVVATSVAAHEANWEPSTATNERWATQSKPPWVTENEIDGPELEKVKSGRPWEGFVY